MTFNINITEVDSMIITNSRNWEYTVDEMPAQKIETGHNDVVHDVSMDYYGKRVATASSDG